ncbi:hypothetical protein K523DRAFT_392016 [Schizophyllum commune Tattone D]|nr:hypothetical protein K523DRAFT_392016 [Schizophyllum commune Tattone D]
MAPLPRHGAYAVISLDPAASLWDIDDAIVREEIAKFKCGRYVATASKEHHALSGPMPVRVFTWDFLMQGLPSSDQRRHFKSYQTVPVFPTTEHPENRRPVEPLPHLPWENCYHARMYRTVAICANRELEEDPQSCLCPEEAAVLDQYLSTDIEYTHLLHKAKKKGRAPPPREVPAQVLMAIRLADEHKRTDGKPWMEVCRQRARERHEAASTANSSGSAPPAVQTRSSGDAIPSSSQRDDTAGLSLAGESQLEPADAAATTVPPTVAVEATQERYQSVSTMSGGSTSTLPTDGPEGMLAALLGIHELDDHPAWVKIESYNIEQFDVPPDPLGFFAELYELHMCVVEL